MKRKKRKKGKKKKNKKKKERELSKTNTNMMVKKAYRRIAIPPVSMNVIYFDEIFNGTQLFRIEYVTIYVKLAQTDFFAYYNINIHWSMTTFLEKIRLWILTDTMNTSPSQSVKLVETGQPEQHNAPCVESNDNMTYINKYLLQNKWPSFYVILNH